MEIDLPPNLMKKNLNWIIYLIQTKGWQWQWWNGKKLSMTLVENILTYCEEVKEHEPCFARFR